MLKTHANEVQGKAVAPKPASHFIMKKRCVSFEESTTGINDDDEWVDENGDMEDDEMKRVLVRSYYAYIWQ